MGTDESSTGRTRDLRRSVVDAVDEVDRRMPRVTVTTRRSRRRFDRAVRLLGGRLIRVGHRLQDWARPIEVDDDVLAERVRSTLGLVARDHDVPEVAVSVRDARVALRGVVREEDHVVRLRRAASRIPGVVDVTTDFRVGRPGDDHDAGTADRPPSRAHGELVGVVRALDVGDEVEVRRLAGAALAAVLDLLPADERRHVEGHLPADVRRLVGYPRHLPRAAKPRTPEALFTVVSDATGRKVGTTDPVVRAVMATLRELVPEELGDVHAVLPGNLKPLWAEPLGTGHDDDEAPEGTAALDEAEEPVDPAA